MTKLHVHTHIMVIYIQNKINEIRLIVYCVMVEDRVNYLNLSNQMLLRIS